MHITDFLSNLNFSAHLSGGWSGKELSMPDQAKELERRFQGPPHIPDDRLAELHQRLVKAWEGSSWENISVRDWRNSPQVFWTKTDPVLIECSCFLQRYLEMLTIHGKATWVKILLFVVLRDFDLLQKSNFRAPFRELGKSWLGKEREIFVDRDVIDAMTGSIREFLGNDPHIPRLGQWAERHRKYHLFTGSEGPKKLSADLMANLESLSGLEGDSGLTGQLSGPNGFLACSFGSLLENLKELFREGKINTPQLSAILQFSIDNETGDLRFDHRQLAQAILLPWVDGLEPESAIKTQITDFMLHHFGNPSTQRGKWQGIDDEACRVMRRWLAHKRLLLFFDIIDKTALDEHWRYRRAFWESYYQAGHIEDAWVAFGPDALRDAKIDLNMDIGYGRLTNAYEENQSVLLLEVGSLVVCEWSHNGKVRVWNKDSERCPTLNEDLYRAGPLRQQDLQIHPEYVATGLSHQSSESYHWQVMLSKFIMERTSIVIPEDSYRNVE